MIKTIVVNGAEVDVLLKLPRGEVTIQLRDYAGEGEYSVDVLLPEISPVHNWRGVEMKPAKPRTSHPQHAHVRMADQVMFIV